MAKQKKLGKLTHEPVYFYPSQDFGWGVESAFISGGECIEILTSTQARKFVKNLRKLADNVEAVADQVGKK